MKRAADTNNILEEIHDYCINFSNRQIFLHDSVKEESEYGIDYKVSSRFIKNMAVLEPTTEPIVIHQMSHGGQCDAGFAIYDCIKTSNCHITVVCHGFTMSMATLILQAADERVAMPNCLFMFHEGEQYVGGTHKVVQSWAELGKKTRDKMVDVYAERCQFGRAFEGKTLKQVRNYITSNFDKKEDWILTAEEALHHGFIDKILADNEFKDFVQRN
jgi:ATP-dependent Clp protease, protease subunit